MIGIERGAGGDGLGWDGGGGGGGQHAPHSPPEHGGQRGRGLQVLLSPSHGVDEEGVGEDRGILIRTQITIDQSCDDISAVVILTSSS